MSSTQHSDSSEVSPTAPGARRAGAALANLALARGETGDTEGAHTDYAAAYARLRDAGDDYRQNRISVMTGLTKMANRCGEHAEARTFPRFFGAKKSSSNWDG